MAKNKNILGQPQLPFPDQPGTVRVIVDGQVQSPMTKEYVDWLKSMHYRVTEINEVINNNGQLPLIRP
ncbi:MAG: hypothetical protein NTY75_00660 [Candidatus Shapirobacteria bacterium]|nr:hypothetical protein [Candidatus Shapirobacteria bacterium]